MAKIDFTIPDLATSPPGGFEWTEPSTGAKFKHYDWIAFSDQVREHRLGNNIPMSPSWQEELVDQLCKQNAVRWQGVCRRAKEGQVYRKLDFGAAMSFGNLIRKWFKSWASGEPAFVPQEEAERRASICAGCPNNREITFSCGACMNAVLAVIALIVGKRKTEYDIRLGACLICSCALKPAVHVPLDIQHAGLTEDIKEEFKQVPWCWKKME